MFLPPGSNSFIVPLEELPDAGIRRQKIRLYYSDPMKQQDLLPGAIIIVR